MERNIAFNAAFDIAGIISLVLMFGSCMMNHSGK